MKKNKIVYHEALDSNYPHLGGNFLELNPSTYSPPVWNYIITNFNISSVLDVGSGTGYAAKWFADQGITTTAIDGLPFNIDNAVYPTELVDLTKQSFSIEVDLVHSIELVEHVEEKYLDNLLDTLCCGKYLVMTHGLPGQEGHHHVNCQPKDYWLNHLADRNFIEMPLESSKLKILAKKAKHLKESIIFFKKINE